MESNNLYYCEDNIFLGPHASSLQRAKKYVEEGHMTKLDKLTIAKSTMTGGCFGIGIGRHFSTGYGSVVGGTCGGILGAGIGSYFVSTGDNYKNWKSRSIKQNER